MSREYFVYIWFFIIQKSTYQTDLPFIASKAIFYLLNSIFTKKMLLSILSLACHKEKSLLSKCIVFGL